ncbi:MAG: LicD family protein [Oscillospiraceae bacterium]
MKNKIERKNISREELKSIQLEIMGIFHKYCEDRDLRYYLTGGTLIGAVRHQGYIPWDDDIDVIMPRTDYETLIKSFNKDKIPDMKILSTSYNTDYYLPFSKMINTKTVLIEKTDIGMPIGVYIDIFPLDNMSDDYNKAVSLFNKIKRYRNLLTLKTVSVSNRRAKYKNVILQASKIILSSTKSHNIAVQINRLAQTYESEKMSKFVCATVISTYGIKEIMDSSWYQDRRKANFEGRQFWIPGEYHSVLSNLYGNYMLLPPKEKQVSHHKFEAYWKGND